MIGRACGNGTGGLGAAAGGGDRCRERERRIAELVCAGGGGEGSGGEGGGGGGGEGVGRCFVRSETKPGGDTSGDISGDASGDASGAGSDGSEAERSPCRLGCTSRASWRSLIRDSRARAKKASLEEVSLELLCWASSTASTCREEENEFATNFFVALVSMDGIGQKGGGGEDS